MFAYDCPECEKRTLLFSSQIRLVNDDQGIAVLVTCWCGAPGAVRTGKAARQRRATSAEHALAC